MDGCTKETTIALLQTRVDILTTTIAEIKDSVRRIEEAVGIIRIIELQAKQQNKELEGLTVSLRSLEGELKQADKDLDSIIEDTQSENSKATSTLSTKLSNHVEEWKEKYNLLRGIWIGVTAVFSLVGFLFWLQIQDSFRKIEDSSSFIQTIKTLDIEKHLKEAHSATQPVQSPQPVIQHNGSAYVPAREGVRGN